MIIPFETIINKNPEMISDYEHEVLNHDTYKEGTIFISCSSEKNRYKEYCVICEDDWLCTCPAFRMTKEPSICKHIKSVTMDINIIFEKITKDPTWCATPKDSKLRLHLLEPEQFKRSLVSNLLQFGRKVYIK